MPSPNPSTVSSTPRVPMLLSGAVFAFVGRIDTSVFCAFWFCTVLFP